MKVVCARGLIRAMSALRMKSKKSPAAPLLNDVKLARIMREVGYRIMRIESAHAERTWHAASAIMRQIENQEAFGAAEGCAPP
jgi:hypothetical protein